MQCIESRIESSVFGMCHACVVIGSTRASCRHVDSAMGVTIEDLSQGCRPTYIGMMRAFDIPAHVPEHVRPVARTPAASSESATTLVALVNDGVVE